MRKWPIPRRGTREEMLPLVEAFHGYGGMGNSGSVWVAEEESEILAAWAWQPPPFGAAKAVSPGCPAGALSLSRMVAVPRERRGWHLSKPLRWIMRNGLDRGRFPVLVTYADVGQGHCGHVYKCSGWQEDGRRAVPYYEREDGTRISSYSAGSRRNIKPAGRTEIIRFVHRACPIGEEEAWIRDHGWNRVEIGGRWKSGSPKRAWVNLLDVKEG